MGSPISLSPGGENDYPKGRSSSSGWDIHRQAIKRRGIKDEDKICRKKDLHCDLEGVKCPKARMPTEDRVTSPVNSVKKDCRGKVYLRKRSIC